MELSMHLYLTLYIGAASMAALMLYGADKLRARKGSWRIPERLLLGIGLLGGAPGALSAMMLFRHKTAHWYFWTANSLAGAVWLGLLLKVYIGIN